MFSNCQTPVIWLNPMPIREDIGLLYLGYNTHKVFDQDSHSLHDRIKYGILASSFGYRHISIPGIYKCIGKVLSMLVPIREMAWLSVMMLYYKKEGRLLDIGCGNGRFLNIMRGLGWEVYGIEPDYKAARIAREVYNIPIVAESIWTANLPANYFDAITLHQVIEHLEDPVECLRMCLRALKPGGELVIVTPNSDSMGAKIFKKFCVHFDAPRHLYLMSTRNIVQLVQNTGFCIHKVFTSARWARSTWVVSRRIKNECDSLNKYVLRLEGVLFQAIEMLLCPFWRSFGEEIVLILTKPQNA